MESIGNSPYQPQEESPIIPQIKKGVEKLYADLNMTVPEPILDYLEEFKHCKYEIVVLGNSKAGKSSLLNEIMSNTISLNTGAAKETAFRWRLSFSTNHSSWDIQKTLVDKNTG